MATYFNLVPCKGIVWKQSFISRIHALQEVQTKFHSEGSLRMHKKWTCWSDEIYCTKFNDPYKYIISLYLHSPINFKKLRPAFSRCIKAESLTTRKYVLSKTKTCRIVTEFFHFYDTCFILSFLFKKFLKTVGELLHLLTLHPKLIFLGALKKVLMVPEPISYQTQYFSKIFPSPLASTLNIHFYLYLNKSAVNVLWIVPFVSLFFVIS